MTVTFRRNGDYDSGALQQLNWFLRDWRVEKPAQMDPRLFDIIWEVYRESGSSQPINIISAYRSPETNGALRRRSSGVAEHSQHMLGKAMDIRLPDVDTARLRAIAMKMQYGGVGYYSSSAFVHVDTGNVRAWPRMTQQQLVQLFPDGKTLHLPSNGKPLPGYELAKAEILQRNAALATQASAGSGPSIGNLFANLFGRKNAAPASQPETQAPGPSTMVASADPESVREITLAVPLPPQRPPEIKLAAVALAEAATDAAEATVSPANSRIAPELEAIIGYDETAAAKSLFDPRTAFLDLGFTSDTRHDLSVTRFSGPAVKPLPVVGGQAQAELVTGGEIRRPAS
ncbi:YcbK family protein [Microvirga terrae]|uniref:YcbK family protein n=1 Tax=Microvirga terrae TaxID=2740529 RepID=UPI0032E7FB63